MKRRHLLVFIPFVLLILLIGSQTAINKLIKSTHAATITTDNNQLNKKKNTDSGGIDLSSDEISKTTDFLNLLNKTKKCVVYANEISRTNHIEGNIIVNNVNVPTTLAIYRVTEKQTNDYSYVGNSTSPIQLSDNGKIFLGSKIKINKPNSNQTVINGGYSNNISAISLSEKDTSDNEKEIISTLDKISIAGEALKSSVDNSFFGNSTDSFKSVDSMMEKKVVSKGDIVIINIDYTQILNNEGAFGNLLNSNSGTIIVVNIIIPKDAPKNININKAFSSNVKVSTDFNPISSYIIWNFGNYDGNININEEMVGIIVAPKASVYQAAGNLNGQIISNIAGNNGELHQVTIRDKIPEPPTVPEETKPTEPESSSNDETTSSETESESQTQTHFQPTEPSEEQTTKPTSTTIPETTSSNESTSNTTETYIDENNTDDSLPKTGDTAIIVIILILLIFSGSIILINYIQFKNHNSHSKH